jgi:FixJ family two-component response regulator
MPGLAPVVCLVDDDASVRKSVARVLESSGFRVDAFSEPEAFLGHVAAHSFLVAVVDIWMDNMTGHGIARPPVREITEDSCYLYYWS